MVGTLWSTLRVVYARLEVGIPRDEVFEQVVLARIVEPTFTMDTRRVLAGLGVDAPHYTTISRHLRRCQNLHYRDQVAKKCYEHASTCGDVSLVLYDVTTLYVEADKDDQLRRVGYSKERRVDPLIVVGLLVDRGGFPLEIGCFEGNHAEARTIIRILEQFAAHHQLENMVVVADAGMLSVDSLTELAKANLRFIVGSRQDKAPGDLTDHFHRN